MRSMPRCSCDPLFYSCWYTDGCFPCFVLVFSKLSL